MPTPNSTQKDWMNQEPWTSIYGILEDVSTGIMLKATGVEEIRKHFSLLTEERIGEIKKHMLELNDKDRELEPEKYNEEFNYNVGLRQAVKLLQKDVISKEPKS